LGAVNREVVKQRGGAGEEWGHVIQSFVGFLRPVLFVEAMRKLVPAVHSAWKTADHLTGNGLAASPIFRAGIGFPFFGKSLELKFGSQGCNPGSRRWNSTGRNLATEKIRALLAVFETNHLTNL
jgi:hypothetical protein